MSTLVRLALDAAVDRSLDCGVVVDQFIGKVRQEPIDEDHAGAFDAEADDEPDDGEDNDAMGDVCNVVEIYLCLDDLMQLINLLFASLALVEITSGRRAALKRLMSIH